MGGANPRRGHKARKFGRDRIIAYRRNEIGLPVRRQLLRIPRHIKGIARKAAPIKPALGGKFDHRFAHKNHPHRLALVREPRGIGRAQIGDDAFDLAQMGAQFGHRCLGIARAQRGQNADMAFHRTRRAF